MGECECGGCVSVEDGLWKELFFMLMLIPLHTYHTRAHTCTHTKQTIFSGKSPS